MTTRASATSHSERPASEIPVYAFRQMLMWPVLLEEAWQAADDTEQPHHSQLSEWVELLAENGWRERDMLPKQGPIAPPGMADLNACQPTYEEVVYFHPFIRDLFYGDGVEPIKDRTLRCLFRDDINIAEVSLNESGQALQYAFRVWNFTFVSH